MPHRDSAPETVQWNVLLIKLPSLSDGGHEPGQRGSPVYVNETQLISQQGSRKLHNQACSAAIATSTDTMSLPKGTLIVTSGGVGLPVRHGRTISVYDWESAATMGVLIGPCGSPLAERLIRRKTR